MLNSWRSTIWHDLRLGTDPEHCADFIETTLEEADGAPTPSDPLNSPPSKRKAVAQDRRQDEDLAAAVFSKTEIMVLKFQFFIKAMA